MRTLIASCLLLITACSGPAQEVGVETDAEYRSNIEQVRECSRRYEGNYNSDYDACVVEAYRVN